jgi:hypothetical protein
VDGVGRACDVGLALGEGAVDLCLRGKCFAPRRGCSTSSGSGPKLRPEDRPRMAPATREVGKAGPAIPGARGEPGRASFGPTCQAISKARACRRSALEVEGNATRRNSGPTGAPGDVAGKALGGVFRGGRYSYP